MDLEAKPFLTGHEEIVHDIKYDFYGKHIATASSDQHIKVFELENTSGAWVLNDLWKAHEYLVIRLSWAHPEFTSSKILASCSFDRTVKIWQEQVDELYGSGRRWLKLATLAIESHGPIYDVAFAPHHLGLKVGCVGLDGIVRIYESVDPADLTNWALTSEIPILSRRVPAKSLQSSFGIEWCPSKFARTEKFIVVALDQGFIYGTVSPLQTSQANDQDQAQRTDSIIKPNSKYVKVCSLPDHNGLIRSVSWAPTMGRSYHLIATGCKDGYVRIFKATESVTGDLKFETLAKLADHELEVWKVSWNSTGTILSSAGDDGEIRLWKSNYLNEWKCMSVINTHRKGGQKTAQEENDKT